MDRSRISESTEGYDITPSPYSGPLLRPPTPSPYSVPLLRPPVPRDQQIAPTVDRAEGFEDNLNLMRAIRRCPNKKATPSPSSFRSEKGQASVLIGMMMVTFMLFFAFVVNTGMLVNAKINLQNAADLAAYAGASVQARQLNSISYLNYEMRRFYKKFLFRYYIIGNLSLPPDAAGGDKRSYKLRDGTPLDPVGPSVCIIFNVNDNVCQNASINPIKVPQAAAIDALQTTLREQLLKIESIRQQNCLRTGITNLLTTYQWLLNTDPEGSDLQAQIAALAGTANADLTQILPLIRGLTQGLGLLPKLTLLNMRAKTLADYLNTPNRTKIDRENIEDLREAQDPMRNERTIQAFLSAYETLGEHTFDGEIRMDELLPEGPQGSDMISLQELKLPDQSQVRYAILTLDGQPTDTERACKRTEGAFTLTPFTLGVSKDPNTLTYYAVRLQAQAKLMFNPFGGSLQLTAYSAAMPFGSRIGPPSVSFTQGNDPFLQLGSGHGFDLVRTTQMLSSKMSSLTGISGTGANQENRITASTFQQMYELIMSPNEAELGLYNIPNDQGDDAFMTYFDGPQNTYAFWAPLQPLDKVSDDPNELADAFLAKIAGTDPENLANKLNGDVQAAFKASFNTYVSKLREGQGEGGEGFNVYRMSTTSPVLEGITVSDANRLNTSWADLRAGEFAQNGRTGYSVKYISFDSLVNKKVSTNGANSMSNPPNEIDGTAEIDFKLLKH